MSSIEEQMYINLGKNVRKYRLAKGLSQEKLSEIIDAGDKFVGHVERFERYVGLKKLNKIAQALDVELRDLFDFREL